MSVLDASALLAFLQGEAGSDLVETQMLSGARCGAANWSEVAQKVLRAGRDWDLVKALLGAYSVEIEEVSEQDAEWAALRWRPGSNHARDRNAPTTACPHSGRSRSKRCCSPVRDPGV